MAGLATILNIGKEAVLTHQTAITVASNNVANVDTPGYSRQSLTLTTAPSAQMEAGFIGNGVFGVGIERQFDQFITEQVMNQSSRMAHLESFQQSYQLLETVFNEASDLALSSQLSQFWESWQEVANNPELTATRQSVAQQGQLLVDQLQAMASEIGQIRSDLDSSLAAAVDRVNDLSGQIAELNGQISSTETPGRQQNSLRDQRDELVKELAGLVEVNYFETSNGSYTILMADGHSLVENDLSSQVIWTADSLAWKGDEESGSQPVAIKDENGLGGQIGALLEARAQISEGDPDNYLGRLDGFAEALIREVNDQYSLGGGEPDSFFTGSSAATIGIEPLLLEDPDALMVGTADSNGEVLSGDNSNAMRVHAIKDKDDITFSSGATDSLSGSYNTLVAAIGLDSKAVDDSLEYNTQLNDQLLNLRDSISGVSLDEEMANLLKYQQAYSSAAKLITIADEMFQSLLSTL